MNGRLIADQFPLRCALCGLTLGCVLVFAHINQCARNTLVSLAAPAQGERAYRVSLKSLPVGQLVQKAQRTVSGNYVFSSQLEFQLSEGQPVRVAEEQHFHGRPPYQLFLASQRDHTQAQATQIEIRSTQQGLSARVARSFETDLATDLARVAAKPLAWRFGLSDYLAVEQWLTQTAPALGTSRTFRSLDFARLDLAVSNWTYLGPTDDGHLVTKSAPQDAIRMHLNKRLQPLNFTLAGTFELNHIPLSALPVITEPVFHSETYQVGLDRAITDHTHTSSVTLSVTGNTELVRNWASASETRDGWQLENRRGSVRIAHENAHQTFLREELSYPSRHAAITALAELTGLKHQSPATIGRGLTQFVHDYIRYDHHSTMQSVLDVIDTRRGDCNEYAELFTTLARALNVPARTVIGLAYTEKGSPAFGVHAWNEVLLDGQWHGFDPTWNETVIDATHIALPSDEGGLLMALTSLRELEFGLLSVQHLY